MNVSHEKVLRKMEQEITAAKSAHPGELDRHVYAIKSMCELLIGFEGKEYTPPRSVQQAIQPERTLQPQPQAVSQAERISTEDGSNGESIFDF